MTITTRVQAIQQQGLGRAQNTPTIGVTPGAGTAAAAGSGFIQVGIQGNSLGTTYPATIIGFPRVASPANAFRTIFSTMWANNTQDAGWFGIFYKLGTVDLTASGNAFTHDAATFPVLRNNLFGSNKPVPLRPVIYITTATATTAPAFIIDTSVGGTGYVNQAGSNVVGTKTFTMPAASTNAQSAYYLKLEDGDSGVQDIVQINMTSSGSAGAATIYGFEELTPLSAPFAANSVYDGLLGILDLHNQTPAVATSGTATTFTGFLGIGSTASLCGHNVSVRDS